MSVAGDQFLLHKALTTLHIERAAKVTLPDGSTLTFGSHGHKRTLVGGPPSPLIIHGAFAAPAESSPREFSVNVHREDSRFFRIRERFLFELVNSTYDQSMDLRYFGEVGP
jgi:hypothetical protein